MIIIKKTPKPNGTYTNQTWGAPEAPEGYYAIPAELKSAWEQYKPFVTLTVVDGVITALADNAEARAAQVAADAAIVPEPTAEERISALETLVLELGGII